MKNSSHARAREIKQELCDLEKSWKRLLDVIEKRYVCSIITYYVVLGP